MRVRNAVVGALVVLALHAASGVGLAWGEYSITVSASPCALYVNGRTSTVTAHVMWGDVPVIGHTIRFTIQSGPGSVNPSTRDTNSSGNASTTYTSSASYGTATIRATDLDELGQPYAQCIIKVFKITQNRKVFWFDGNVSPNSQPAGYDIDATLTANGTSTGTFAWQVTSGFDDAGFLAADGQTIVQSRTISGNNKVTLKAKDESAAKFNVKIKLTYNGTVVINTWNTTVWGPHHLVINGSVADSGGWNPNWWQSDYSYQTKVLWGENFPNEGVIGVNEEWTPPLSHAQQFPNYNWGPYPEDDWNVTPNDVTDTLWIQDSVPASLNPTPQPGNGTLVDWQDATLRMGSHVTGNGVPVKPAYTIRGYLGYGRHDPE